jgi:hypothetical protein
VAAIPTLLKPRTTSEVLDDHLARHLSGELEPDIARNYSHDVLLLTNDGVLRGHAGVRHCARLLEQRLPGAALAYRRHAVDGEVAYLEWSARSGERRVEDGVDTFLVRDGLIVVQTVRYTVTEGDLS